MMAKFARLFPDLASDEDLSAGALASGGRTGALSPQGADIVIVVPDASRCHQLQRRVMLATVVVRRRSGGIGTGACRFRLPGMSHARPW